MKRRIILSIALVVSVAVLSLIKSDSVRVSTMISKAGIRVR